MTEPQPSAPRPHREDGTPPPASDRRQDAPGAWVFGYGSLMWNPGFPCVERRPARMRGYHRAYMMYSTRNRGTPAAPGMVLSLAPGGECVGMALRVDPARYAEALAYLDKREGVGRAHRRVLVPVHLVDAPDEPLRHVWVFLPILTYSNYIWGVPLGRQAELVAHGAGATGTSYDYLRLVLEELARLGVAEPTLERLFDAVRTCRAPTPGAALALAGD